MIQEVICVSTEEAKSAALEVMEKYGFCVGMSSGANYVAARKLRDRFETVVTVFSDGYSKYKSLGLRAAAPGRCLYRDSGRLA